MTIHVVQNGETIQSIADQYGVAVDRLILENGIKNPNRLVVGEAIVVLVPEITHTVLEGDTLEGIANQYEVTVFQLLRNNPYLSDREFIYPGEAIVISFEGSKIRTIATNGYVYPFIEMRILRKTLPFLTTLTVFSYKVTAEGDIIGIEDTEIVQTAKVYGVEPIMMLEALSQNLVEEINVIRSILINIEIQEQFIDNLIFMLQTKGYSGVSINTPYIQPQDRSLYKDFFTIFSERLAEAGFKVYNTFSIRIFQLLNATIFTGLNSAEIARLAYGITLIAYEFGYSEGIPQGTIALETLRRFLENATRLIPSDKIDFGISVIGYVWTLPYNPGISRGMAVSYDAVLDIAYNNNTEIQFDEITNSAYFQYISGEEFVVRFWDARSIDNFVKLVPELDLNGIGIWNIMNWFPQVWLIINSQYDILKTL